MVAQEITSNISCTETMSKEPVEEMNSYETKKMDSLNDLKEILKRIEVEIENETTNGDKYGKSSLYHETHIKKCIESEKFTTIYKQLPMEEQIAWMIEKYEKICKDLPKSLVSLLPGVFHCGVAPRPHMKRPDWLDMEKFRKGQQFFQENHCQAWLALLYGLNLVYSFEIGLQPMVMTGKSSTPYKAFKRYLSTMRSMDEIYFGEPWTEGSPAQKELHNIRMQHFSIWNKLHKYDSKTIYKASTLKNPFIPTRELIKEDVQASCPIPAEGQCPFNMWAGDSSEKFNGLSQIGMTFVQFGFVAFIILKPEAVGIHNATDENIEAFCHMWKGIAYLLGIEDEFNFCNGTVEEIKQRAKDLIEYWIKPSLREYNKDTEHMLRALYEGTYYYPVLTYEITVLHVSEILGLDMPNLRASLSYSTWIYYNMYKFGISRLTSLAFVRKLLNMTFSYAKNQALNYDAKKHAELKEKSSASMVHSPVLQPLPMA